MSDLILSITVLAALILFAGAAFMWRNQGNSRKALLMAVLGFVMLANVAIWAIPVEPEGGLAEGGDDMASTAASGP